MYHYWTLGPLVFKYLILGYHKLLQKGFELAKGSCSAYLSHRLKTWQSVEKQKASTPGPGYNQSGLCPMNEFLQTRGKKCENMKSVALFTDQEHTLLYTVSV